MRLLKKILIISLTLVVISAVSFPVSAAGISPDEQKILDRLNAQGAAYDVTTTKTFIRYHNMIENWLLANDVSAERCAVITACIDTVAADYSSALASKGLASTDYPGLKAALSNSEKINLAMSMVNQIAPTFATVNIKLTENMVAQDSIFSIEATLYGVLGASIDDAAGGSTAGGSTTDGKTTVVATMGDTIKQTGFDVNITVTVCAGLAAVLVLCVVVIKKQGLISASEVE